MFFMDRLFSVEFLLLSHGKKRLSEVLHFRAAAAALTKREKKEVSD